LERHKTAEFGRQMSGSSEEVNPVEPATVDKSVD